MNNEWCVYVNPKLNFCSFKSVMVSSGPDGCEEDVQSAVAWNVADVSLEKVY